MTLTVSLARQVLYKIERNIDITLSGSTDRLAIIDESNRLAVVITDVEELKEIGLIQN